MINTNRKPVFSSILDTIGNTPIVQLDRLFPDSSFNVFAKLEAFNPGGSIKDRPAYHIIKSALDNNEIDEDTTIVESSSGNFGIGAAQVCRYLGLKFLCVVDARTTFQNVQILRAYGADVKIIEQPDPVVGTFLQARLNYIQELLKTEPNSFWCNQYANLNNPLSHHKTMQEIFEALDGKVDYIFCATSTCGTLRGCGDYVRLNNYNTKVVAVDAQGSVIFGHPPGKRLIPGHGAGIVPSHFSSDLPDDHIIINDLESVWGCHRLLAQESILAGGSSGAIIAGLSKKALEIPDGANCVVMIADRGERYLSTVYDEEWVSNNFGDALEKIKNNPYLAAETAVL